MSTANERGETYEEWNARMDAILEHLERRLQAVRDGVSCCAANGQAAEQENKTEKVVRPVKELTVRWKAKGSKTTIACFQCGEHFSVREVDMETHQDTLISQTFSEEEAWLSYTELLQARMQKVLHERDKERRPEDAREGLVLKAGLGHITDLQHPFITQLYEDYRDGNRMRHGDALTKEERHTFDLMVLEFLWPDMPEEIRRTLQASAK